MGRSNGWRPTFFRVGLNAYPSRRFRRAVFDQVVPVTWLPGFADWPSDDRASDYRTVARDSALVDRTGPPSWLGRFWLWRVPLRGVVPGSRSDRLQNLRGVSPPR